MLSDKIDLDELLALLMKEWDAEREEERDTWRRVFLVVDVDGNNMMDCDEFCEVRGLIWACLCGSASVLRLVGAGAGHDSKHANDRNAAPHAVFGEYS